MSRHVSSDGPRWLLPHMWHFFRSPVDCYLTLAERYGQPFSVPSPFGGRMLVTGQAQDIASIFRAGGAMYRVIDRSAEMVIGGAALSALDGAAYIKARQKLLAAPVLRDPRHAADLLRDAALRIADRQPPGKTLTMLELARSISLDANIQVIFGFLEDAERENFAQAIHRMRRAVPVSAMLFKALRRDFGRWSPWGRFARARDRCYALINAKIDAVLATQSAADGSVLAYCASARDESGHPSMTRSEIGANLLSLLFGGHDTTASAVAWGIYWTHTEPGVLAALHEELGDYAESLDTGALRDKPYLDAVGKEILRMYPIAPGSARRLAQPMTLGGRILPEGDLIMASMDLIARDATLFPNPTRFRPERFLERSYRPHEFIPFGGGERRCPGAVIATEAIRVVLATLLCRFTIRLMERRPVKPMWNNGIRVPRSGVKIMLERKPGTGALAAHA